MKTDLAEELLSTLMGWPRGSFVERVRELESLAAFKFDEYGNFRPGIRFFESLASWLGQFDPDERETALSFVRDKLVFVSDAEMIHLIELVYPDHILPILRRRVGEAVGLEGHLVGAITSHAEFASIRRRSLVLGASDGARLDRLRRSATSLSHEQFLQSSEPPVELIEPMRRKLASALGTPEEETTFCQVFLVDDFSGSGRTLLREEDGQYKGKLVKLDRSLRALADAGLLAQDFAVAVILYLATEQAIEQVHARLAAAGLPTWQLRTVQSLPRTLQVSKTDPKFAALAEKYYDEVMTDEHKGRAPLGYADCELPVVLAHNTPNNSVSLLWADTTAEPTGQHRRALFPRYERHHKDRP